MRSISSFFRVCHARTKKPGVAIALALLVVAPSCSSGSGDSSLQTLGDSGVPELPGDDVSGEDSDGDSSTATETDIEGWQDCMLENGVDPSILIDGEISIEDVQTPGLVEAQEACQPLIGEANSSEQIAERKEQSAQFAKCARDVTGLDFPDDVLILGSDDPKVQELTDEQVSPEQSKQILTCINEILMQPAGSS